MIYLTAADDGDVTQLENWTYLHTQLGYSLVAGALVAARRLDRTNDDSHSKSQVTSAEFFDSAGNLLTAVTSTTSAIVTKHQPG